MLIDFKAPEYLENIQRELQYIRKFHFASINIEGKEMLQKFERVYQYIFNQYQSKQLSDQDLNQVYGYFLQTIKRFKRRTENLLKHSETDYISFKEIYRNRGIPLVETLQKELKLDYSQKLKKFDYDAFTNSNFTHHLYTKNELCDFAIDIFDYIKIFETFPIDKEVLRKLLYEISLNYNIIPYHNFTHAFQLFQLLFTCYEKSYLNEFVNQVEIFAALLSGLAHDLNHKGVNNGYKIKKSQKNNLLTSEQAVLENMHCATFFNLLHTNKNLDIIESFGDNNQKNLIKRLIITSILATDFSKHNKLVAKFTKRVDATNQAKQIEQKGEQLNELLSYLKLNSDNIEDRRFVLNIFVHACDISNPVLNFDLYMNWSFLLTQEFHDQTIKEAQKGLEVTGFLKYNNMKSYYDGQTFFSKQMVLPLWKQIGQLFPTLQHLPDQLEKNLESIQEEKQKLS